MKVGRNLELVFGWMNIYVSEMVVLVGEFNRLFGGWCPTVFSMAVAMKNRVRARFVMVVLVGE